LLVSALHSTVPTLDVIEIACFDSDINVNNSFTDGTGKIIGFDAIAPAAAILRPSKINSAALDNLAQLMFASCSRSSDPGI